MRGYELCLILHPDTNEDQIHALTDNLSDLITKNKGRILKTENWGKKNFKYHIKKQTKGFYCFLYYLGNSKILGEIERVVRYNESILRYNTLLLDKNFTAGEAAKAEKPQAAAKPAEAEEPQAAAEPAKAEEPQAAAEPAAADTAEQKAESPAPEQSKPSDGTEA